MQPYRRVSHDTYAGWGVGAKSCEMIDVAAPLALARGFERLHLYVLGEFPYCVAVCLGGVGQSAGLRSSCLKLAKLAKLELSGG